MRPTYRLNGAEMPFEPITVQALLQRLGVQPDARGAAVAVNGAVVPRREWPCRRIAANDDVEVVRPFSGG
jgi:sulfur carrier protein